MAHVLLLTSSNRNFPTDIESFFRKAGKSVKRIASIEEFIQEPKERAFLGIFEIGSLDDYARARSVFHWAENVQPVAVARYILLLSTRNLEVREKIQLFHSADVVILPMPLKNILFKADLQWKLLQSARRNQEPEGFLVTGYKQTPFKERILLFKGPGPEKGKWLRAPDGPKTGVRWRWVEFGKVKSENENLSWEVKSEKEPRYEPSKEWSIEGDANLVCLHDGKEIFSAVGKDGKVLVPEIADDEPAVTLGEYKESSGELNQSNWQETPDETKNVIHSATERSLGGTWGGPAGQTTPQEKDDAGPRGEYESVERSSEDPKKGLATKNQSEEGRASPENERQEDLYAKPARKEHEFMREEDLLPRRRKETGDEPTPEKRKNEDYEFAGDAKKKALHDNVDLNQGRKEHEFGSPIATEIKEENKPKEKSEQDKWLSSLGLPVSSVSKNTTTHENSDPSRSAVSEGKRDFSSHILDVKRPESSSAVAHASTRDFEGKKRAEGAEPKNEADVGKSSASVAADSTSAQVKNRSATDNLESDRSSQEAKVQGIQETQRSTNDGILEDFQRRTDSKEFSTSELETRKHADSISVFSSKMNSPELASVRDERTESDPLELERREVERRNREAQLRAARADAEKKSLERAPIPTKETKAPVSVFGARHFTKMTLEMLRDKNSSWQPVDKYRIYLSAQTMYATTKDISEIFPLWVYEGELAPEFLPAEKSWKFYDRPPAVFPTLESLPKPVQEHICEICGIPLPEKSAVALPLEDGYRIPVHRPGENQNLLAQSGDKDSDEKEKAKSGGFWKKVIKMIGGAKD